jgi:hypothetical protein
VLSVFLPGVSGAGGGGVVAEPGITAAWAPCCGALCGAEGPAASLWSAASTAHDRQPSHTDPTAGHVKGEQLQPGHPSRVHILVLGMSIGAVRWL